MYLSRVEIRNFRCLKDVTIDLQPGLNVLVGRNNTGKTNVFSAIRQAIGPSGARGEPTWLERDDFYREAAAAEPAATMAVTLTFSSLSKGQRAHFYEIVDFDLDDVAKSTAVIRFEASWPKGKRQATIRRTGGPKSTESPEVPSALLESLPITFLPALRDAETYLAPGYRSRLAVLLRDLAERQGEETKNGIRQIYANANEQLENHTLISTVMDSLQSTTEQLAGTDYTPSAIKAAEVEFERVLRTLQVQMDGSPISSLDANGLGYNNVLYIAVILEHLKSPDPDECPLLLVEEPEAHLHPQLTALLADYLANITPGALTPQTIVSTHSTVLATRVPPSRVSILATDHRTQQLRCNSIANAALSDKEEHELQRMMDVTRAALYFAKGAILVEGITEALLLPVLAKRLGHNLNKLHISVIPICGVSFGTFKKLLAPGALEIPVAIVTDGDPPVKHGEDWEHVTPKSLDGAFLLSDRTKSLLDVFNEHPTVRVYHSQVTLEYDLAEAGPDNSQIMAEVWESCFNGQPRTFNCDLVEAAGESRDAKALVAWRGICRAEHSGSKAEFIHRLSGHLEGTDGGDTCPMNFVVPDYITRAIRRVSANVKRQSVRAE